MTINNTNQFIYLLCYPILNLVLTETSIITTFTKSKSNWWRITESNRWPPACKAGALPTELIPHVWVVWWA